MSNNSINSNQNPYTLYGGQDPDMANPDLHYPPPPPPPYYNLGQYYGQALPAAAPSGAATYLPSATLYSVPSPQQSAYQITGGPTSLSDQDDYYYNTGYGSSVEQQRESFVSINPQNPPLHSQCCLSSQDQDVPLPSTVLSSSLPLGRSDSSPFHQNEPYSAINSTATAQNMGFSSVHGDHSSSIQSAASMSVFNIPPTSHYMESGKHSEFPIPIHSDTLRQTCPSTLGQGISTLSRSSSTKPPLLMRSGPALTEQGGKKLRQRPSASKSTKSAPEVSMAAQQSEPSSHYKQNCPPVPMQGKHRLTVQNVPVPTHSILDHNESLPWQNASAPLMKTSSSLQMSNNPSLPQGLSETPQQLCSPNHIYNTPQSALSSADNPAHVFIPPYPPPPITGHTSTYTGKPELEHDFGPYKAGQSEEVWLQIVQHSSLSHCSNQHQSVGSDMKSTAATYFTNIAKTESASIKTKKTEESSRSWAYDSTAQRAKSNDPAKDRSGRDNEHPYRPILLSRSRSRSPESRSSGYRSRRETRSPKRDVRKDRRSESYSRYHKPTVFRRSQSSRSHEGRYHSRTPDRHRRSRTPDGCRRAPDAHHRSQTPEGRRHSRSPGGRRHSRSPGGRRHSRSPGGRRHSRSPGGRRHSRSPGGRRLRSPDLHIRPRGSSDELLTRSLYGGNKVCLGAGSKAKGRENSKPSTVVREEDMIRNNPLTLEDELKENEKRKAERWDHLRNESIPAINEMQRKLDGLSQLKPEEILEHEKNIWTRSSPSDLFYARDENCSKLVKGTTKLNVLTEQFKSDLLERAGRVMIERPKYSPPPRRNRMKLAKHKCECSADELAYCEDELCNMEAEYSAECTCEFCIGPNINVLTSAPQLGAQYYG